MVLAWCPSRMPESEPVRVNATEQCELLATAHKEAEAFKDLAQRKCEELDAEVAALQTDLREREAYMATQQAALSAMEEEAHAQAAADAQDEARFRGDLQALLDAHLLPPLAAARQMAREAAGVVGECGRAEEAERIRLGLEVIARRQREHRDPHLHPKGHHTHRNSSKLNQRILVSAPSRRRLPSGSLGACMRACQRTRLGHVHTLTRGRARRWRT